MAVIQAVDSWQEPNAQQIAVAKAHGIGAWLGYFKIGNDGIYHGWSDATFKLVKAGGLETGAFCSDRADPVALRARAAALDIVLIDDVESSVQGGDSPRVDPFLKASGAGMYGGGPRGDGAIPNHLHHGHLRYVVSDYELNKATQGRGSLSWPPHDVRPVGIPVGWQYQGGTAMPWGNTDLAVYDATFFLTGPAPTPTPTEDDLKPVLVSTPTSGIWLLWGSAYYQLDAGGIAFWTPLAVPSTATEAQHQFYRNGPFVQQIAAGSGGLTAAQDTTLTGAKAGVDRLVAELHTP